MSVSLVVKVIWFSQRTFKFRPNDFYGFCRFDKYRRMLNITKSDTYFMFFKTFKITLSSNSWRAHSSNQHVLFNHYTRIPIAKDTVITKFDIYTVSMRWLNFSRENYIYNLYTKLLHCIRNKICFYLSVLLLKK